MNYNVDIVDSPVKDSVNVFYFASSPHPIHEGFMTATPAGYKVKSNITLKDTAIITQYDKSYRNKLNLVKSISRFINFPRILYIKDESCDLIHTNSGILVLNKKPWVVSVEYGKSFFLNFTRNGLGYEVMKSFVAKLLRNKYCMYILPYSNASRNSILNIFSEYRKDLEQKMQVVYPSIKPFPRTFKNTFNEHNAVRLLFTGEFFRKGGKELLKAFELLNQHYNIELVMIVGSYVDNPLRQQKMEKILSKYRMYDNIQVYTNYVSRDRLFHDFYSRADLFVLPTFGDTFGYSLLEAMSCGLPVISTDEFAIPEIVSDGVNGFVIQIPEELHDHSDYVFKSENLLKKKHEIIDNEIIDLVVRQLVDKISLLLNDHNLMRYMSYESQLLIDEGKFSIKQRNKLLQNIYSGCFEEAKLNNL